MNIKYILTVSSVLTLSLVNNAFGEATNTAVMQGLDKVTARVTTIEVPLGETVYFGALKIKLYHCDKTSPEETPESAAFIEVIEEKRGEEPLNLFNGWMFASSPALSSIEHPVYDVWVLDCVNRDLEAAMETKETIETKEAVEIIE